MTSLAKKSKAQMAPKQKGKLPATTRKQLVQEIEEFLEAHREEAEKRIKLRLENADKRYFQLRDDIIKAAEEILPKSVLDANLFEFIQSGSTVNDQEEVADELPASNEAVSSENIDIASSAVAAFENLSIPVERSSKASLKVERCSKASHFFPSVEYVLPGFSVQTPLQDKVGLSNLPSVIHPKVEQLRANHFRAARGNEIAFSVDGSPIVVQSENRSDPESIVLRQMMEGNEEAFSPDSRAVVANFKNLLRQKAAEAAGLSQELD
ncbi:hypothetical protein Y032_0363g3534 [Ancylostoma ceylanicum]|nr:hypothetical protein Y032_0363g3534 [Ancylostoma ceylanicum]